MEPIPTTTEGTFAAFSETRWERRAAFASYLGAAASWLLVAYLAMLTFDGALRFYLAGLGAAWAVYLKDVFLIVLTAIGILRLAVTDLRSAAFGAVLAFIGCGLFVGAVMLRDIRQPLFEAKAILPLLCGTVIAPIVRERSRLFRRVFAGLLAAVIGGIVLTFVWRAPWVGFVYDVGGTTVAASREWSIGDAQRVAGFSRASFDAALQCLCFGALVATFSRRYVVGLAVWLVTAGAVYLTLSRSAMVAVIVGMVLHALVFAGRSRQRLAKVAVVGLAIAVTALPFAAAVYYKDVAGRAETRSVASTSSFEDRALNTWPAAFELVSKRGNVLVGRGLGGIGVAQQFFEPDLYSPGDNLFVYLWGALGLLGVSFLAFIGWRVWRSPVPFTTARRAAVVLCGALLAVGLTLNVVEAAVASLCLGIALVWLRERGDPAEADVE